MEQTEHVVAVEARPFVCVFTGTRGSPIERFVHKIGATELRKVCLNGHRKKRPVRHMGRAWSLPVPAFAVQKTRHRMTTVRVRE